MEAPLLSTLLRPGPLEVVLPGHLGESGIDLVKRPITISRWRSSEESLLAKDFGRGFEPVALAACPCRPPSGTRIPSGDRRREAIHM